jgi:hypothetical protein
MPRTCQLLLSLPFEWHPALGVYATKPLAHVRGGRGCQIMHVLGAPGRFTVSVNGRQLAGLG